jgi:hypothetical protein
MEGIFANKKYIVGFSELKFVSFAISKPNKKLNHERRGPSLLEHEPLISESDNN